LKKSVDVSREQANVLGLKNVTFIHGAVNDKLTNQKFDRLHGGYMMNRENAGKYCKNNLNNDGIAVLNVGSTSNFGSVYVLKKDANGNMTKRVTSYVNFQEDRKP